MFYLKAIIGIATAALGAAATIALSTKNKKDNDTINDINEDLNKDDIDDIMNDLNENDISDSIDDFNVNDIESDTYSDNNEVE